jgi:N-acetylmuramoyl-L-alanine amidase
MRTRVLLAIAGGLLGLVPVVAADAPAEFRGAWVSRFEWVSRDPDACQENIRQIFQTLADANFNTVVFQIRGAAETLYPSEIEPWSPLIGGADSGFDPVALAIEEAHARGIAFHAYINPMPLRALRWPDAPQNPDHLFYRHGPTAAESWVCVDRDGRPAKRDYYYLSAGIPAVHAYLREVILDVVRRYDVDGIHLDRIRYPGPEYSHDPVSRRRFIGRGNPRLRDRADWQREQLNKLINDLAAEIRAEKPHVVMSCAAWGIYNRYHIDGYGGFSSGYHDYFQDTWYWCRLGAMDVLMPMIYWNLADPKPNYDELIADFVSGVGPDHLVGGQRVFSPDENAEQIRLTREAGALGTVLWNYRSAQRRGVIAHLRENLYQEEAPVPEITRLSNPEYGTILGTVLADDGQPLVDAWVSIQRRQRGMYPPTWTTSADGRFAFLNVRPGRERIEVRYEGVPEVVTREVEVRVGEVTTCEFTVPGSAAVRDKPYVALVRPGDGTTTERDVVHVLGRTHPRHKVTVGGEAVDVYATGGFARDNIPLQIGENRIEIVVKDRRRSHTRVLTITRVERRPETGEPVEPRFMQPAEDVALQPGQLLEIRVKGPPGREGGTASLAEYLTANLAEILEDEDPLSSVYVARLRVPDLGARQPAHLRAHWPQHGDDPALEFLSTARIEIWDPAAVRVAETTAERTGITHGLHSVRLGGPWLAWVPQGTRFEVIERRGANCHIRLSASVTGWVAESNIRWLDPGTAIPHNFTTGCHVDGNKDHDVLSIGMSAPVVVAVRSETRPGNRLYVDFFNSHHALTWISRKSGAQVIGPVRAEQIEENWLRLTLPLNCRQNWGYWTEIRDGRFRLYVRRPPAIAAYPASSLSGRTIALEAGHGGSGSGAVGPFGTKEKTVNLAAARALERELTARGARVVQVRRGDENLSLSERVARANAADADLYVSLHANAAGTRRGHLRVSGTSTYYHDIHCYLPARLVYDQLLALGWDEFGVVGNFSYLPLRNTRMPAILIEQAFMSHPGDEARLLDPNYQKRQAIAIANGLETFFDRARESAHPGSANRR